MLQRYAKKCMRWKKFIGATVKGKQIEPSVGQQKYKCGTELDMPQELTEDLDVFI